MYFEVCELAAGEVERRFIQEDMKIINNIETSLIEYAIDIVVDNKNKMACCRCSRYRGLCKGCACFYCLPGRDGHCLNPLNSSNVATVPSVSITSLKAHSTIDQSSLRTPNRNILASPCIDLASPCSIVSSSSDRESVYGETPACGSFSWTTSPFCGSSTCGSHKVPDFADFSPMAEPNFLWNDIDGESFSYLVKSCYDEIVHWRFPSICHNKLIKYNC